MRWMLSFLLCSALGVRLIGIGTCHAQSRTKPERLLPAETLAVLSIPDFEQTKKQFKGTALSHLWQQPEVQQFLQPVTDRVYQAIGEMKTGFRSELGIPIEEFYPAFGGGICFALVDLKDLGPVMQKEGALDDPNVLKMLSRIVTQQRVFRAQAEVDQDGDGWGEYGLLGEMAGQLARRPSGKDAVTPAYLAKDFATGGANGKGFATVGGYNYRVFLPAGASSAGDDASLGGSAQRGGPKASAAAIDLQEKHFLVYAWPEKKGESGKVYVANEKGETYSAVMKETVYGLKAPKADAAYPEGAALFQGAIGGPGKDQNQWKKAKDPNVPGKGMKNANLLPELALLLTPGDREAVERLVSRLDGMLQILDPHMRIEAVKLEGAEVAKLWHEQDPRKKVVYRAWIGPTLVLTLGSDSATMERILSNGRRKSGKSLSDNPLYARVEERTLGGKSDFFLYLAPAQILAKLNGQIPDAREETLKVLGLSDLQAAGASMSIEGKGIRDVLYLHTGEKREGLFRLLPSEALDGGWVKIVPEGATSCFALRFKPESLWGAVEEMMKAAGPETEMAFRAKVTAIGGSLGLDIPTQMVPAFGGNLIAYSEPDAQGVATLNPLESVFWIGIKDQTKAEFCVNALRERIPVLVAAASARPAPAAGAPAPPPTVAQWQQVEHRGHKIHYLSAQGLPLGSPAYALTQDYLIVAMRPDRVRRALDRLEARDTGIRGRADFQMVEESVGAPYGALWYADMKAVLDCLYPLLPAGLAGLTGGGRLDAAKLPPAPAVKQQLFGHIMVCRSDAGGISIVGFSPLGGVGTVAGLAGVGLGATVLPDLLKTKRGGEDRGR